jgi:hypothetical protein
MTPASESARLQKIAAGIFDTIARHFPVAAASDEFYYFPQVQAQVPHWRTWDCFCADAVVDVVEKLSADERELQKFDRLQLQTPATDRDTCIDVSLLRGIVRTLIEQLAEIKSWETQPTWHLTVACVGLAEAIETEDPEAVHDRIAGLAVFLDQAARALKNVPILFRDLGLEMAADTRDYLLLLANRWPGLNPALDSLQRFEDTLHRIPTRQDFLQPAERVSQIIHSHLKIEADIQEIENLLEQEIRETQGIFEDITGHAISPGSLENAYNRIALPRVGRGGLLALYRQEVDRLGRHCLDQKLVSMDLFRQCPVRVALVPPYLSATRTASSYSIPPGHPPEGGVFFVINAKNPGEENKGYQREYRILTAHETYPGHHLLDSYRWNHSRPIRRVIERPFFYEGWACFAEELLRLTGYFGGSDEGLLLARRRLWRAIRGKIDLGLQTGTMDLPTAARNLVKTGVPAQDAMAVVRKYPLNPGYQLCYTTGIRRFLDLFQRCGRHDLHKFATTVLGQGEIGFQDLEQVLVQAMGKVNHHH